MNRRMKVCKPGQVLLLCGLCLIDLGNAFAVEWQITPQVEVAETYSDNITLAPDTAVVSNDYITQITPGIEVKGTGRRLTLDSSYTLQSLYYAKNSERNQTYNQLHLAANAELIDEFFYLSADGRLSQQLLSPGASVADNLNINSGRGDVVTTRIQPSIKHRLGKFAEFDLSYSEGRVNYGSAAIADARLQETKFFLGRAEDSTKLDWLLSYSQSQQWATETLSVEREQSAAVLRYPLFDHFSVIANGGKEEGRINSLQNYQSGSYWSAGANWRPSAHFLLEAASGDKDQQARLLWNPGVRTSLSIIYLNRDVGVRASNTWTGTLQHSTRRTRWILTHVKEITSDAALAFVYPNGDTIRGEVYQRIIALLGITEQSFTRSNSVGSVTYSARKNDFSLGVSGEQRDYALSGRQAQLHGGYIGWHLRLSPGASSDVRYAVDRASGNSTINDVETVSLVWSLKRSLGKGITTGLEMRTTEMNGGAANVKRSENRLSANARVIF